MRTAFLVAKLCLASVWATWSVHWLTQDASAPRLLTQRDMALGMGGESYSVTAMHKDDGNMQELCGNCTANGDGTSEKCTDDALPYDPHPQGCTSWSYPQCCCKKDIQCTGLWRKYSDSECKGTVTEEKADCPRTYSWCITQMSGEQCDASAF